MLRQENAAAEKYWSHTGYDKAVRGCGRGRGWTEAFHWYVPAREPRSDGGYFTQVSINSPRRDTYERLEAFDKTAGLLGVLPEGLRGILRLAPKNMHESNRRQFNKTTEQMITAIRLLLARTSTRLLTKWITNSSLWIRIFWAPS